VQQRTVLCATAHRTAVSLRMDNRERPVYVVVVVGRSYLALISMVESSLRQAHQPVPLLTNLASGTVTLTPVSQPGSRISLQSICLKTYDQEGP
jgi:hypothetical protein